MMAGRIEPELPALRKLAEDLALRHGSAASSAHLLAAVANKPSAAADLLAERRLTPDALLRAAHTAGPDPEGALKRSLQRAREIAGRMGASHTNSAHVLVAVLGEPRSAARRVLDGAGIDVSRLRASAMNIALGIIGRRRASSRRDQRARVSSASATSAKARDTAATAPDATVSPKAKALRSTAQIVSLVPQPAPAPPVPAPEATAPPTPPTAGAGGARFTLDPQKFPTLCSLGKNLMSAAAAGELDKVVGRDTEIEHALDVLAKRQGNNPCLVGVAGVGKTSVVRGIARRIASGRDVACLDDRIIVEISAADLVAGTAVRGALATRFAALKKEVAAARGRVVLFFDEIHQLFSADAAEEIGADLKLALGRGELPCIGATTFDEYRKTIESDSALARRFTVVEVEEPSREDTYLILEAVCKKLAQHHGVRYRSEALALSVAWSIRYLSGRALPDKAVSVLDLAGARVRRRGGVEVSPESVAEVVSDMADVPISRLLESDKERWLHLERLLAERVVGHEAEMRRIARILRRNAAGLAARRPMGSFLLLGPTGVGKTETAKAIAATLFHADSAMTRIDMAEFSESHAVARLIGAPPGYVGHDAGGQLTEAVRRRPYQVVLLDEIEKAHPDVLLTFLGMLDEGRLTDGRGRTIDFTSTVVVMTSNIGAEHSAAGARRRVGFGTGAPDAVSDWQSAMVAAARSALPPELYNRIDEVLAFCALGRAQAADIAERLLRQLADGLRDRGVKLQIDAKVVDYLLDRGGFDPSLGVRPLKRTLARLVEAPLAEKILSGELARGDVVLLAMEDDALCFDTVHEEQSLVSA